MSHITGPGLFGRMMRSAGVGLATTTLTNTILVTLTFGLGVPAGVANVIGTLCGIAPSYAWNRRYAWRLTGASSWKRQVVPFWVLSIVGLVASTGAVAAVARLAAGWPPAVRGVALPFANLSVFATLWLVQFLVLDRFLFAPRAGRRDGGARPERAVGQETRGTAVFRRPDPPNEITTRVAS